MLRQLLVAGAIAGIFSGIAVKLAFSAAGKLDKPGIAVPSHDGTPDATAAAINAILAKHEKHFVGGHFINAHTELAFGGGTKTVNSLLAELSKIEGAFLYVKFSRDDELVNAPEFGDDSPKPYDCTIAHNAWADGDSLHITIRLGGNVAIEELSLPAIRGHAAAPKESNSLRSEETKKPNPRIKELQNQRLAVLEEVHAAATTAYQNARTSFDDVHAASVALLAARLDYADTQEDRIQACDAAVEEALKWHEFVKAKVEAARGTQLTELQSRAYLLETQIAREKVR